MKSFVIVSLFAALCLAAGTVAAETDQQSPQDAAYAASVGYCVVVAFASDDKLFKNTKHHRMWGSENVNDAVFHGCETAVILSQGMDDVPGKGKMSLCLGSVLGQWSSLSDAIYEGNAEVYRAIVDGCEAGLE